MEAAPPELDPIVARPSGSSVSLTFAVFSARGRTSVCTYSAYLPRHGVILQAALAAWPIAAAASNRDRNHHRNPLLRDQDIQRGEALFPVRTDEEGCRRPRHILLGHIDRHMPRIRRRMAGGDRPICPGGPAGTAVVSRSTPG